MGAGEDLYALFAGILTMKPWNRVVDPAVDHLVIQGTDNERSELQVVSLRLYMTPPTSKKRRKKKELCCSPPFLQWGYKIHLETLFTYLV